MSLELFEKHPEADAYRVGGAYQPYAIVAVDKRFTDGELAAEWWRKAGEFDSCTEGYSTAGDGYLFEAEEVEAALLDTIRRFAALPHASDTNYE